jgi:choline dehydrogenase-like flavoprotein
MTARRDILIVGGGIAGCSAAIALSARGHRVEIVEREAEWRFQSSGIFVYANGLVSMDALGLMEDIVAAGFTVPTGATPTTITPERPSSRRSTLRRTAAAFRRSSGSSGPRCTGSWRRGSQGWACRCGWARPSRHWSKGPRP